MTCFSNAMPSNVNLQDQPQHVHPAKAAKTNRTRPRVFLAGCFCWLLILLGLPGAIAPAWGDSPLAHPVDASRPDKALELPEPKTHYMGREIAQTMHFLGAPWLVRESREREEDCRKLLAALPLKLGVSVCDIGCGNGYYTLRLAGRVGPDGRVYASDIQQEMLNMLVERAKARQFTNILPILGTLVDPHLPRASVDLILAVDVYHEFAYPEEMLAALRSSLKPTGHLVLVEFRSEDPTVPIKPLHKMSQAQIMRELLANGFKLVGQFHELPWQHVLSFARDDSPLPEVQLQAWNPLPR
jgi:SAM-dependent methyltransferase